MSRWLYYWQTVVDSMFLGCLVAPLDVFLWCVCQVSNRWWPAPPPGLLAMPLLLRLESWSSRVEPAACWAIIPPLSCQHCWMDVVQGNVLVKDFKIFSVVFRLLRVHNCVLCVIDCRLSSSCLMALSRLQVSMPELPQNHLSANWLWVLYYYCHMSMSQGFQPMAAQLSVKAALPLAERIATASDCCSNTGPWSVGIFEGVVSVILELNKSDIYNWVSVKHIILFTANMCRY